MKTRESVLQDNTEFRKAVERARKSYRDCLDQEQRTVNISRRRGRVD